MSKQVGLWIDHRQATIVTVTGQREAIIEILSDAEKQPRRSGDSPLKGPYEALQVPADDSVYDATLWVFSDRESICHSDWF